MNVQSSATTKLHTTFLMYLLLVIFGISDIMGFKIAPLLVIFLGPLTVFEFRESSITMCWRAISIPVTLLGGSIFLTPYLLVLLLEDQGKLTTKKGKILSWMINCLIELLENVSVPFFQPMMGCNNISFIQGQIDELRTNYRAMVESIFTGVELKAEHLRDPGLAKTPIPMRQQVTIPEKSMKAIYKSLATFTRTGTLIIIIGGLFFFMGPLAIIAGFTVYLAMFLDEPDRIEMGTERGNFFKDGIYRITNTYLGFEISKGIGVVHNGIMHIPYHVCSANSLYIGKNRTKPYYIDRENDITTYGGPPAIGTIEPGMKIYANCENDDSRVSYIVNPSTDSDMTLMWPGMTKPGESGSPLYGEDEEGKLHLVGLCGRYYQPTDREQIEFSTTINRTSEAGIQKIVMHPGSGKTRRVLPKLIKKNLDQLKGKRILVTGPTRVVCKEIAEALKQNFDVGLNLSDTPDGVKEHAMIQVAAHASALSMINSGARALRNLGLIIIDEAHVDDVSTILLRKYVRGQKIPTIEMSATLDGENSSGSNHAIRDEMIHRNAVEDVIRKELELGSRVLVFACGVKSKPTEALMDTFRDYNPIILSRCTFSGAMASIQLKEGEGYAHKLIISTDIAECGINIPDLDVVVDTMEKFTYVRSGNLIYGQTITPNTASVTQRRGRVGRSKPGRYYFTKEPDTKEIETAAQFDAKILATGRAWGEEQPNEWNIELSDSQFTHWTKEDKSPLWVYLSTTNSGATRSEGQLRSKIKSWTGNTYYIGCKQENCECKGNYRSYDERNHDYMFSRKIVDLY